MAANETNDGDYRPEGDQITDSEIVVMLDIEALRGRWDGIKQKMTLFRKQSEERYRNDPAGLKELTDAFPAPESSSLFEEFAYNHNIGVLVEPECNDGQLSGVRLAFNLATGIIDRHSQWRRPLDDEAPFGSYRGDTLVKKAVAEYNAMQAAEARGARMKRIRFRQAGYDIETGKHINSIPLN